SARTAAPYVLGVLAGFVLLAYFVVVNRRLPGIGLVATGLTLNTMVVVLDGAMPVSTAAAARAGLRPDQAVPPGDVAHLAADATTRLRWLGDTIAFPLPGHAAVLSPGDLLVAAGVGLAAYTLVRTWRPGRRTATRPSASTAGRRG
ncbi:MAG: DUF5317 domain-containing protein, partial [Actinomycetes bacterium]